MGRGSAHRLRSADDADRYAIGRAHHWKSVRAFGARGSDGLAAMTCPRPAHR
jgi:hypothetical protein